jgi:hypothetical protein
VQVEYVQSLMTPVEQERPAAAQVSVCCGQVAQELLVYS